MQSFVCTIALMLVSGSLLTTAAGCGNSVNAVKDATLFGREETTVGDAFDSFFSETSWVLKEKANKSQFVEFTGRAKTDILMEAMIPPLVIPKNGKVLVQFTINVNETFEVSYVEAALQLVGGEHLAGLVALQGIKIDGSPNSLNEEWIQTLLANIYGN